MARSAADDVDRAGRVAHHARGVGAEQEVTDAAARLPPDRTGRRFRDPSRGPDENRLPLPPAPQTERLRLRAPTLDNAFAYHEILSLREVTRHINLRDSPSSERSRKFVRWTTGLHSRGRGCAWIMEPLATHDLVGAIRIDELHSINTRLDAAGIAFQLEHVGSTVVIAVVGPPLD